jgi:hypothetical protein
VLEDLRSAARRLPLVAELVEGATVSGLACVVGGPEPLEGRLALLLLALLRPRRVHVAPRPTGKADEAPAVHLHTQAPLAVGTMEGA